MADNTRLFGTDGIRSVAGEYPLDPCTVCRLGRSLGGVLLRTGSDRPVRVLVGRDTRESGSWIVLRLAAGLRSVGVEVVEAGVMTTPGLAFLTGHHGFAAGVAISASHNPYEDNGIKVFSRSGTKLSEVLELEVESALEQMGSGGESASALLEDNSGLPGAELRAAQLLEDYLERLSRIIPTGPPVTRYRLVVDCAHGAASHVVPQLMRRLGMQAQFLHVEPNGRNINLNCGSLYPQVMVESTRSVSADLGVAFDGDADRAIFSTREGKLIDGDYILAIMAPFLKTCGILAGSAVVGTQMTNLALEIALDELGIGLKRTPVGDKYVLEEMQRSGLNLGGEPSGHIIFGHLSLSGDGIITLLQVVRLMAETGQPLEELTRAFKPFPQIIRNVRVREKPPLHTLPEVSRAVEECRRAIGERGRVVVRYSGTEPLARVMVEAARAEDVEFHAARIAEAIQTAVEVG